MEKEQNAILEAIDIIVKKRLRNLGFDYYVDGVITAVNISKNVYTVLINGVSYENVSAKHKLAYQLNDTVQILIKNGNWKKKFIDGMANHTKFLTSTQYNSIDPDGVTYPMISQNDKHLWIGAYQTATRHHRGRTYVSSGYDGAKGNETIYVSVPNEDNTNATNYKVMHSGNLKNYTHSVGSVYITNTNTNPSSFLGGTWELIDKQLAFAHHTSSNTNLFELTSNASNCTCTATVDGHQVTIELSITTSVDISDTSVKLGTFKFQNIGINGLVRTGFTLGLSDAGEALSYAWLGDVSGELNVIDIYPKTDGSVLKSGSVVRFVFTTVTNSAMDDFCDKFYWKRTA